jgi:hypothetical protein
VRKEIFHYAIEAPAWGLGYLLGELAHMAFIFAGLATGIAVGRFIWLRLRIKFVAWPLALMMGFWVTSVIVLSEPWAAVEMQRAYHDREDE